MKANQPRSMIVAGVMSGTSADGVDVAICRIAPAASKDAPPKLKLLGHQAFPYSKKLRAAVLAAMDAKQTSTAELARLSWRLGEVYAECIETAASELKLKPQLIACHGQTIYHQAKGEMYLGKPLRCTWQIGEAAPMTERLQLPVVSDFRPSDFAAGGQGAPLVPMLDFCVFQHATKNRVLLNLGGIANMTSLPAGGSVHDVIAFDSGPANMVMDACMQKLYGRGYDRGGVVAARGKAIPSVIERLLTAEYFAAPPPKSCGREEYGEAFTAKFIAMCEREGARKPDIIATAAAFTVATVIEAYRRFCWPHLGQRAPRARATELLVAGGGAKNPALMDPLRTGLIALGVKLGTTEKAGLPVDAKEAAAFALLGWLRWNGLPGNVPSATGAQRPAVLGKVSLP